MTESEKILDQIERAFTSNAWLGAAVPEILEGVTARMAAARPVPGAHSIWEIVHHMTVWIEVPRRRMAGEIVEADRPEEDWPPVADTSEAAWRAALGALDASQRGLRADVAAMKAADLTDLVPGKSYAVDFMLHGVVQHTFYHAGQIAILARAAAAGTPGGAR